VLWIDQTNERQTKMSMIECTGNPGSRSKHIFKDPEQMESSPNGVFIDSFVTITVCRSFVCHLGFSYHHPCPYPLAFLLDGMNVP
jgi:hypothetical protein